MALTVHFIGTVHTDPLGASRLEKALEIERPDAIACEMSPEMWEYRVSGQHLEQERRVLDEHLKRGLKRRAYEYILGALEKQMFEARIPLNYGQQHEIPVRLVDSRKQYDEDRPRLERIPLGDITQMNRVTREAEMAEAERLYAEFQELFTGPKIGFFPELEEWKITAKCSNDIIGRDDVAEARIREKVTDGRLVMVYGLVHCLHDLTGQTLFTRLQDFNPTRATLADARYR